ncbi:DNA topoisomerase IV subunit A [Bacteroidota bacterium]|nr:DNA topoisomerase IV subunit A [Bacteroidota bacterium]
MSEEEKIKSESLHESKHVESMYKDWFLDYASYVILERAVPAIEDGFKPVQRRIVHAMKEMDDGRFNKAANIIGQTMQYHPHGDASIGDAMVNIGQKDLLIETQGNWGDVRTGDSAAAPRYIEARLSKFALEVVFNTQTTRWQLSYDGRKKEPLTLPVKFPLLLAQGVEGIAVGLSTKVLPHNFCELLKGSIDVVRNKKVSLYPDFLTGGLIDVSNYNDGARGGKVRVRARIEERDKKTLIIKDVPFSVTTTQLIESIVKANDNGKIKIKKVVDNTAADVEVEIQLAPGISPDITIDALYAFTDCEISISPSACVIINDKPHFVSATELLKVSTDNTMELLKRELEIKLGELDEDWHFSSLEKIFIEKRIYRDIEECETWEAVIIAIDKGLSKYKKLFKREITEEDIVRLTEIRIKRISKFDSFKADEHIKGVEEQMKQVKYNLEHLKEYTIEYFENLLKKFGKGRERKTEVKVFDTIQAKSVAIANQKLYVNRTEGFIGHGLKKDEFVLDCSDLDDIIVFRKDGKMVVTRVAEKTFVGKDILYLSIFNKNDERIVYHMIYQDGKTGPAMVKRFNVTGITRDKEYDLTKENEGSKVLYFSVNPNGENEIVTVTLNPSSSARIKIFEYDFREIGVKGRGSIGNIITKYPVRSVKLKSKGAPMVTGKRLWFDEQFGKLNTEEKGKYLGNFEAGETILSIFKDGNYEITNTELTNKFDASQLLVMEKFNPAEIISALYYHGGNKACYLKRFSIETQTLDKKFSFMPEEEGCNALLATTSEDPKLLLKTGKKKSPKEEKINVAKTIEVKTWKAVGNKVCENDLVDAEWIGEKSEKKVESNNPEPKKEIVKKISSINKPEIKSVTVKPSSHKPENKNEKPQVRNSKFPNTLKQSISKMKDVADVDLFNSKTDMEWEIKSDTKKDDNKSGKKSNQASLF